jgi:hypothetical protein
VEGKPSNPALQATANSVLRDCLRALINDGAQPVARLRWRRKPLHERVRIWIAYGVARFFIGWFGYARKH